MNKPHEQPWNPRTPPVIPDDLQPCPILVLHYWAGWNLHDRAMDDLLLPLQREYADRICFRSCDVDLAENQPFIHGIANIPALGCFIRGKWFKSVVGMHSPTQLHSTCDQLLAAASTPSSAAAGNSLAGILFSIRRLLSWGERNP